MSPAIFAMSIGMLRRWQAKMVFMMGMYWCAKSPDTETIRMRDVREGAWAVAPGSTFVLLLEGERRVLVLFT